MNRLKINLIFVFLVLLISSSSFSFADILNEDYSKLEGLEIPKLLIKNEKATLYVDCEPIGFDVVNGVIKNVVNKENENAGLKIKTEKEIVNKLTNKELSFKDAVEQGKVIFEPVSFGNKFKLFFADIFGYEVIKEKIECEDKKEAIEKEFQTLTKENVMTIVKGEKNPSFDNPVVSINAGDIVEFVNNDDNPHLLLMDMVVYDGDERKIIKLEIKRLEKGQSVKVKFEKAGGILVRDLWWGKLRGKVVVMESCSGCSVDGRCFDVGDKIADVVPRYCSNEKVMEDQKGSGELCQEDYECLSNVCKGGICEG